MIPDDEDFVSSPGLPRDSCREKNYNRAFHNFIAHYRAEAAEGNELFQLSLFWMRASFRSAIHHVQKARENKLDAQIMTNFRSLDDAEAPGKFVCHESREIYERKWVGTFAVAESKTAAGVELLQIYLWD